MVYFSHGLTESDTEICNSYPVQGMDGEKYTLVDTPGFDDSSRNHLDILGSIAHYIYSTTRQPIAGIVYVHAINEQKMAGKHVLNLKILKEFSGKSFYSNVALVSTMWDNIREDAIASCKAREHQLIDEQRFWGEMVSRGSLAVRFKGNQASGLEILKRLSQNTSDHTHRPCFIRELDDGKTFEETSAGRIIEDDRKRREQRRMEEIEEERTEIEAERVALETQSKKDSESLPVRGQQGRAQNGRRGSFGSHNDSQSQPTYERDHFDDYSSTDDVGRREIQHRARSTLIAIGPFEISYRNHRSQRRRHR
jgi:hypothetical protein